MNTCRPVKHANPLPVSLSSYEYETILQIDFKINVKGNLRLRDGYII